MEKLINKLKFNDTDSGFVTFVKGGMYGYIVGMLILCAFIGGLVIIDKFN